MTKVAIITDEKKKDGGRRTATTGMAISLRPSQIAVVMVMMTMMMLWTTTTTTPRTAMAFNMNALNDRSRTLRLSRASFSTKVGGRTIRSRYHDPISTTGGGAVGGGGSSNYHTTTPAPMMMMMMTPLDTESHSTFNKNTPSIYSSNMPNKKHFSSRSTNALSGRSHLNSKRSSMDSDGVIDNTAGTSADAAVEKEEFSFDGRTANSLILGQAALVPVTMGIATILKVSNFGFGTILSSDLQQVSSMIMPSIVRGILYTAPLGVVVYVLDVVENRWNIQALKDVTKATNQSVLRVLGGKFLPLIGLGYAVGLGVAAGVGEELLFRGVVQSKLIGLLNDDTLALTISSVIFGVLHAVTPLYAGLATIAGFYFGWIYNISDGNLLVPMVTHAVYDIAALYYSHWTVSKMDKEEQIALDSWESRAKS